MLDVAADLVLLYARAGLPELAKGMIDRVLVPSGDEEHIAEAHENLALAAYFRAQELLQANRNAAEARVLLDRAAKAFPFLLSFLFGRTIRLRTMCNLGWGV